MSTLIIIIVVLAIIAVIVAALKNQGSAGKQGYPYRINDPFLSKAELSFFGVLRQAVGDKAIVLAKVRIADVLATKKGLNNSQRQTAFNKIQSKHFDFVICSSDSAKVLVAVELDDSSHNSKAQIKRDAFVNNAAEAASLPLLRIPAKNAYPIAQLKEQLAPYLGITVGPTPEQPAVSNEAPPSQSPACPKCGSVMVRRQGKTGTLAGKEFWGCQQYPRCRSVLPIGT